MSAGVICVMVVVAFACYCVYRLINEARIKVKAEGEIKDAIQQDEKAVSDARANLDAARKHFDDLRRDYMSGRSDSVRKDD